MIRKALQLGNKTLVISIPKQYVDKHNIKKGDELEIEEKDNALKITSNREIINKDISITINNPKAARQILNSIYAGGINEARIFHSSESVLREIENAICTDTPELEIFEKNQKFCIIKPVNKDELENFPALLRRLFLVCISEDNSETRTITRKRLAKTCKRLLSKGEFKDYRKSLILYSIIDDLENNIITNEIYELFYNFEMNKAQKMEETNLLRKVIAFNLG